MLHTRARLFSVLAILAAACSRPETPKVQAHEVASSPGDVAPASAGLSGLTDSISALADRARIRGAETAPVWLVEISDFQCPFCKQWHDETYKPFMDEYVRTGKVKVAYINFPLGQHQNAVITAEAAMCAAAQSKFWQYHDQLFDSQDTWAKVVDPRPMLDTFAKNVGLDTAAWAKCVDSKKMVPLIMADRDRAASAGVQSTPTFLIGDQVLAGAQPLDDMRSALDAAIAKSGTAPQR